MTPDTLQQRAMITGRVIHQGTGQPAAGRVTITSPNGPVIANIRPDGYFAVSGRPDILFPDLAALNATFELNVEAVSGQYRSGRGEASVMVNLAAGEDFDPPVDAGLVELPADPIYIRGTVRSGVDPYPPIVGATVQLFENGALIASTMTNAEGAYAFNNVVVLAPVELRCSAATFTTEVRAVQVDYGLPVNEQAFRLTPV